MKKRHLKVGFTLLEVLVSISLFAIMTIAILNTMRETSKIGKKIKQHTGTTLSAEIALDRLQRELQMAFDEKIQGSKTAFKSREANGGSELTFSYLESELKTLFERRTSGINFASYKLEREEGKGTYRLMRSEIPIYDLDKIEQIKGQTLAEGVMTLKMEFYDGRNNKWNKEWDTDRKDTTPNFPKAVRIELETVDTTLPEKDWKDKSLKLQTAFLVLNELEEK